MARPCLTSLGVAVSIGLAACESPQAPAATGRLGVAAITPAGACNAAQAGRVQIRGPTMRP
jgi:hypothetical protein